MFSSCPTLVGGLESGGEIVVDPGRRQLLAGEGILQQRGDLAAAAHQQQRTSATAEGADQRQSRRGQPAAEAAHRVAEYLGPDRRVVERSPARCTDLRPLPERKAAHQRGVDQADGDKIPCQ